MLDFEAISWTALMMFIVGYCYYFQRQKDICGAERRRGSRKCETRETFLGYWSVVKGVSGRRKGMRYRWLGEHSGSIGGRNCYPIEAKGKGRRRMDVTSSGTGSPIIGFMIGVPPSTRSQA